MSIFGEIARYWRFTQGLRRFLKEPLTLEESRRIINERLKNREQNLLTVVKKAIYENKASPYLKLLKSAGCEYGDFERMVLSDGIERALEKLSKAGVYVSIEEFKGKKEVRRGSELFQFKESDFDNPLLYGHLETRSGASRSAGTRTIYDFESLKDYSIRQVILLDAFGLFDIPFAAWYPIMPASGPAVVLSYTKSGKPPDRWFSQIDKEELKPSLKNRMGTNYLIYMGRLAGANLPSPEYVSLDDTWKVAEWMSSSIKERGGCCLHTYTSVAVRVCQVAKERGLDLEGAKFCLTGEPVTEAKRREIEQVGASVFPIYVFIEAGFVGHACFNPTTADEVHFLKDSLALIQHERKVPHAELSVDAFLFTSLLPSAPKILLNVESGDWGVIERRSCGCKYEELGFDEHIHHIRGFDKLTGEGMTFIGTDLVRILDEVLPAKFGGSSTDYQLLEEEDESGHTRLSLLISPEVGAIDENEVVETILSELGKGRDIRRLMSQVWSQAKMIRVRRMRPYTTARGKLLPLHIQKSKEKRRTG